MSVKQAALGIALSVAAAEQQARAEGDTTKLAALEQVHASLRRRLYRHRVELGLSDEDVREIDNLGVVVFGGTPKGPAPEIE